MNISDLTEGLDPQANADLATPAEKASVLVIACGALAREILDIIRLNGWTHIAVTCLPANLHNRPEKIPDRLREKIRANKDKFDLIAVAYADCGTGGMIGKVVEEEGATMMAGPHCYSFFAGEETFNTVAEEELGTFYLTDYLARHFETLIVKGMGLDKYPGMRDMIFGNYKRVVYFAQVEDPEIDRLAEAAAERLGLAYEKRVTGYGELATFMADSAKATSA
ncbi:MAG: DUF1638 domain-containing protein [Alphaproteobacteria bacterium]